MIKKQKLLSIMIAATMAAGLLNGCSNSNGTTGQAETQPSGSVQQTEEQTEQKETTTAADNGKEKIFYYASRFTANNVSPHQSGNTAANEVIRYIESKLYRWVVNEDGVTDEMVADLAAGEPIQTDEEGKIWQIPIDPNAKWQNGEPMNADTFIYSFKMALDPKLMYGLGSSLAEDFIQIENAMAYYTQEVNNTTVDWETVGIKKSDDMTLEIHCAQPVTAFEIKRHFVHRVSGPVYEPMFEELMNETRTATLYGSDKDKIMASGPFILSEWVQGSERRFERNPYYLHPEDVHMDGVVQKIAADSGTIQQMFESGQIDYLELNLDSLMKYEDDPRTYTYPSRVVRQIEVNRANQENPILGNVKFRQALYYAIDREEVANLAKKRPAQYYVSHTCTAYEDGTKFRDIPEAEAYLPENYGYNPEKAKQLFAEALAEEGLDSIELTLNYADNSDAIKMMSEYIQKSVTEIFGSSQFKLNLQAMPSQQLTDSMKNSVKDPNSFELAWASYDWASSDFSPNRCFEHFQADYSRRNVDYKNTEIDALYKESLKYENRTDKKKTADLAMQMEQIYIEDVIAIPICEEKSACMFSDRVALPIKEAGLGVNWGWQYMGISE